MRKFPISALAAAAIGLTMAFGVQAQDNAPSTQKPAATAEISISEIATNYKAEAAELRERAARHRKMASHFKARNTQGGKLNFSGAIRHCNKLADQYEAAAKEAEGVAAEVVK